LASSFVEGDEDHSSAGASSSSAPVQKGSPAIHLDMADTVAFGERTTFQVSVPFFATGRGLVDVYAQPYGQPKVRIRSVWLTNGLVNGAPLSLSYSPRRRTAITTVYRGDAGLNSGSRTQVMHVRPSLGLTLNGHHRRVDGWSLIRRGTRPVVSVSMDPAHAGKALRVVVQKNVSGTWRTVVNRKLAQGRDGFVYTSFSGTQPAGTKFRVRGVWDGDADHVAAKTRWRYYRFTR
jgi:hypothetical protein